MQPMQAGIWSLLSHSAGLKCAKCSSPLRGWILYLVVQFLPITLFYILIFVLQISVTSPPMLSFVMHSQFIVLGGNQLNVVKRLIHKFHSSAAKQCLVFYSHSMTPGISILAFTFSQIFVSVHLLET